MGGQLGNMEFPMVLCLVDVVSVLLSLLVYFCYWAKKWEDRRWALSLDLFVFAVWTITDFQDSFSMPSSQPADDTSVGKGSAIGTRWSRPLRPRASLSTSGKWWLRITRPGEWLHAKAHRNLTGYRHWMKRGWQGKIKWQTSVPASVLEYLASCVESSHAQAQTMTLTQPSLDYEGLPLYNLLWGYFVYGPRFATELSGNKLKVKSYLIFSLLLLCTWYWICDWFVSDLKFATESYLVFRSHYVVHGFAFAILCTWS